MSTTAHAARASRQQGGFRRLWRVLRQLFHEVVGAVFAILALGWLNAAFRAWTRDASRWLVALAVSMGALLVFFAVTSDLKMLLCRRRHTRPGLPASRAAFAGCGVCCGSFFTRLWARSLPFWRWAG